MPSNLEDDYFAREDIEKLHRLALHRAADLQAKEREALRKLHHMRCPNCGMELHNLKRGAVELKTCFNCQGIWLDKGGLEKLMNEHERFGARLVQAVLNVFERWTPAGKKL